MIGGNMLIKSGAVIAVLTLMGFGLWSLADGRGGGADPSPSPESPLIEPVGTAPGDETNAAETDPSDGDEDTGGNSPTNSETPTFTEIWPPRALALEPLGCRFGPDPLWEPLALFAEGVEADILARNRTTTWLMIDLSFIVPEMECWVWAEGTETEGNVAAVPILSGPSTPTPRDDEPPEIDINHSPAGSTSPTTQDQVTFVAQATDNMGVAVIEIYLQPPTSNQMQLVHTCYQTETCTYVGGPFQYGIGEYYAIAGDASGNESQSSVKTLQVHVFVY
jgi:hypothetical protein